MILHRADGTQIIFRMLWETPNGIWVRGKTKFCIPENHLIKIDGQWHARYRWTL